MRISWEIIKKKDKWSGYLGWDEMFASVIIIALQMILVWYLLISSKLPCNIWEKPRPREKIGEGNGNPLQYSCLENSMDRGAWWAAVPGVMKSWTQLRDFTFTFHFPALEKEMATHSSVLTWRIPGTGEPIGLLSVGSHRVGHDWSDLAAAAAADRRCWE